MDKEGWHWYWAHNEMKYFQNVLINVDTLAQDYPQVYQHCMDYHLTFLFENPLPYNLSLVRDFYPNMKTEAQSQVVIVWGKEVNITSVVINRILGILDDPQPFTKLQIHPPYGVIRHTLAGVNSMTKWIHHDYKRYH